jgi:hypothetical protein
MKEFIAKKKAQSLQKKKIQNPIIYTICVCDKEHSFFTKDHVAHTSLNFELWTHTCDGLREKELHQVLFL